MDQKIKNRIAVFILTAAILMVAAIFIFLGIEALNIVDDGPAHKPSDWNRRK